MYSLTDSLYYFSRALVILLHTHYCLLAHIRMLWMLAVGFGYELVTDTAWVVREIRGLDTHLR